VERLAEAEDWFPGRAVDVFEGVEPEVGECEHGAQGVVSQRRKGCGCRQSQRGGRLRAVVSTIRRLAEESLAGFANQIRIRSPGGVSWVEAVSWWFLGERMFQGLADARLSA